MNQPFVLCPDFHGATVLALLLNNHTEISALGDGIPPRGTEAVCACGRRLPGCEFWAQVEARLDVDRFPHRTNLLPIYPDIVGVPSMDAVLGKVIGVADVYAHVPLWRVVPSPMRKYAAIYRDFYRTVCELHGTRMFVSGAKNLTEVLAQRYCSEDVERIKVIHLTRDPRGFLHSARKHYHATLDKAARSWNLWHGAFRRLQGRPGFDYLLIRHEDFCADPAATMARIFAFLGVENQDVCRAPSNPDKHHIVGNRMVFEFDGVVKEDASWRRTLTPDEQRKMIERTRPLSTMLGYMFQQA